MRDSRLSIQSIAWETCSEAYLDRVLPNNLEMLTSVGRDRRDGYRLPLTVRSRALPGDVQLDSPFRVSDSILSIAGSGPV